MDTVVNANWYFEQYPDVAMSGMSAQSHYDAYGRHEGRIPKPLLSITLERKLWAGFYHAASRDLKTLLNDDRAPLDDRQVAAWALARWHASNGQWGLAEPFIDFLSTDSLVDLPAYLHFQGVDLLKIQVFLELNRLEDAKKVMRANKGIGYRDADLALAASNIIMRDNDVGLTKREELKLSLINKVFTTAGLPLLKKIDPVLPLCIDNIDCMHSESLIDTPKISILVATYNAASYVESALRGLSQQTWSNIEIIVVDDCSSDGTCEIVQQVALSDSRVHLIKHLTNRGAYAARNTALNHATGDFITTHDSDDWSHPYRIQLSVQSLSANPEAVASIACWTRSDSTLNFKKPRPDGQLIHMSVATLMIRANILKSLGGWDDVRIAADSELYSRMTTLYGSSAVIEVAPGVPLVIARDVIGSLTNFSATHGRTEFFGVRQAYRDMYMAWHATLLAGNNPDPVSNGISRRFPTPTLIRSAPLTRTCEYQATFFGDFSSASKNLLLYRALMQLLCDHSIAVSIFHWPDYSDPGLTPVDPFFLGKAVAGGLDILTAGEQANADALFLLDSSIFAVKPDSVPKVNFRTCEVASSREEFLKISEKLISANSSFNNAIIKASGLFDPTWYLVANPDVKSAGIDPLQHFLRHGLLEGRDPSPEFNDDYYRSLFNSPALSKLPALLHYVKFAQNAGYIHKLPEFPGEKRKLASRPTILVAGHASNAQIFGAERNLLEILEAFAGLKFNVIVTLPSFKNAEYIGEVRARCHLVHVVPSPLWTQSSTPCDWSTKRFCELIDAYQVDAVHANTIMQREPHLAAKMKKIPSIVHVHEILNDDDENCRAIALPSADVYLTLSRLTSHAIANSYFTASRLSCFTSVNVVSNTANFDALDIKNVIDPNRINIGLISSNSPDKGLDDFIKLAKLLESSTPNAECIIIGPENSHIINIKSRPENCPTNIVFGEYAGKPVDAVRQANIVVNLSTCQETFGRTILEGMAARRPVLAYENGAFGELIKNNESGFLLPFRDIDAMASKLQWLCNNTNRITAMGKQGRRFALQNFNPETLRLQLKRAYRALLNTSKS